MAQLPDPRRYGNFDPDDPIGVLIEGDTSGDPKSRRALLDWLRGCLRRESDAEIFRALRQTSSPSAYRRFWDLVCLATGLGDPDDGNHRIAVRPFAFPIILLTGARVPAVVPGTLVDIEAIRALFESHGAVGATRNFGLGNALCPADALESLLPSLVYRWSREWPHEPRRELRPEDVPVQPGREQVHLRFLVGAGISAPHAPSFLETASHIDAWGMAVTRELVRQLAQPAVELLAMPRAPVGLLQAPHAGRCAELEAAFDVFVSNTVRQFRSTVGDPVVLISSHGDHGGTAEIRVSMSSPLDDTLLEGFRWPLHPLDDLVAIEVSMRTLLQDCRIQDVSFLEEVLPAHLASGRLFLRVDESMPASAARH